MNSGTIQLTGGSEYSLVASYIISPSEFYCQLTSNCEALNAFSDVLNNTYNALSEHDLDLVPSHGSKRGSFHVGQLCCARFTEDECWYRAKITTLFNLESAQVYFIDFGNSEKTNLSDLKVLKPEFQDMPPQAVKCLLHDIDPVTGSWTVDDVSFFSTLVEEKELVASVEKLSANDTYELNMKITQSNESVCQSMITAGHGRLPSMMQSQNTRNSSEQSYSQIEIKNGDSHKVLVPWIKNIAEISVMVINSDHSIFELMMKKIQSYYSGLGNVDAINELHDGQACVALFNEDSLWYRATVVKIGKKAVKVLFVDYGNEAVVAKNKLKDIRPDFLQLPKRAVYCTVKGIKPKNGSEWPNPSKSTIEKYYNFEFSATFHHNPNGGNLLVDLKHNNSLIINQIVRDGLAISDSINQSQTENIKIADFPYRNYQNQSFEVQISFNESYHKFWIQPINKLDELDGLMENIDTHYADSVGGNASPKVGSACVALYSEDGGWYRAIVKSASGPNSFDVYFVDYGNNEAVSASDIRNIQPNFCDLPAIACECQLDKLSADVNSKADKLFKELVSDKVLKATIGSINGGILSVILYDGDVNINEQVAAHCVKKLPVGVVVKCIVMHIESASEIYVIKEEDEDLLMNFSDELNNACSTDQLVPVNAVSEGKLYLVQFSEDEKWYRAVASDINGSNFKAHFVDYGNSEVTSLDMCREMLPLFKDHPGFRYRCSLNMKSVDAASEKAVLDEKILNQIVDVKMINDDGNIAEMSVNGESLKDAFTTATVVDGDVNINEQVVAHCVKKLPMGVVVKCEVTHVESASEIYFIKVEDADSLNNFAEELHNACSTDQLAPVNAVSEGKQYLVQFSEDERWCRAVASEINGSNFKAHFIDFGNSEVTSLDMCREMLPLFKDRPRFCYRCSLNLKSVDAATEKAVLDEKISGQIVNVKMINDDGHIAEISVNGESLMDAFTTATVDSAEEYFPIYKNISVPATLPCSIVYIESPNQFFVCRDDCSKLEEFTATLNEHYEHVTESVSDVVIGQLYVAKFSDDGSFYRAVVTDKIGDKISVTFVDYGNSEVSEISAFRNLQPAFAEVPVFIFECTLDCKVESEAVTGTFEEITAELESIELTFSQKIDNKYKVAFSIQNRDVASLLCPKDNDTAPAAVSEPVVTNSVAPSTIEKMSLQMSVATSVFIVYIETPLRFYVTVLEHEDQFQTMAGELQSLDYDQLSGITPEVGKYFLVQFSEDMLWYRAVVTSISGSQVCVNFIDFGNSEVTSVDAMRKLPNQYYSLPHFAVPCSLDVNVIDGDAAKTTMEQMIETASETKITAKTMIDEKYVVAVVIDGHAVEEQLVTLGAAQFHTEMSVNNGLIAPLVFPVAEFPGGYCQCVLSHIITADNFYVTPVEFQENLDVVLKQMKYVYRGTEQYSVSKADPAKPYAVKSSADEQWYRAKIVGINSDKITVQFMDYGNFETTTLNDMKHLLPEFEKVQAFGIQCKLQDKNQAKDLASLVSSSVTIEVVDPCQSPIAVNIVEPRKSDDNSSGLNSQNNISFNKLDFVNGQKVIGSMGYAEGPDNFFIQVCEHLDKLMLVMNEINAVFEGDVNGLEIDTWNQGDVCVAKFSEDETWYRSQIIKIDQTGNMVDVYFVDYGNSDTVAPKDIKKMDANWLKLSAQAIPCTLLQSGSRIWTEAESDSFIELISDTDKQYTVKFIEQNNGKWVVQLFDSEQDVTSMISGVAANGGFSNCMETEGHKVNYRKIVIGAEVSGFISHYESADKFYVTPSNLSEKLEYISEKLQELYEGDDQLLETAVENELYAVKFSDDGNWYRGLITSVADDSYSVFFIDFGNSECADLNSIRRLSSKLSSYEAFCIECCLASDIENRDAVSESLGKVSQEMEQVKLVVLDATESNKYSVGIVSLTEDTESSSLMFQTSVDAKKTNEEFTNDNSVNETQDTTLQINNDQNIAHDSPKDIDASGTDIIQNSVKSPKKIAHDERLVPGQISAVYQPDSAIVPKTSLELNDTQTIPQQNNPEVPGTNINQNCLELPEKIKHDDCLVSEQISTVSVPDESIEPENLLQISDDQNAEVPETNSPETSQKYEHDEHLVPEQKSAVCESDAAIKLQINNDTEPKDVNDLEADANQSTSETEPDGAIAPENSLQSNDDQIAEAPETNSSETSQKYEHVEHLVPEQKSTVCESDATMKLQTNNDREPKNIDDLEADANRSTPETPKKIKHDERLVPGQISAVCEPDVVDKPESSPQDDDNHGIKVPETDNKRSSPETPQKIEHDERLVPGQISTVCGLNVTSESEHSEVSCKNNSEDTNKTEEIVSNEKILHDDRLVPGQISTVDDFGVVKNEESNDAADFVKINRDDKIVPGQISYSENVCDVVPEAADTSNAAVIDDEIPTRTESPPKIEHEDRLLPGQISNVDIATDVSKVLTDDCNSDLCTKTAEESILDNNNVFKSAKDVNVDSEVQI